MVYLGSKRQHAAELLSIILKDRTAGQWYVEPFAGGMNVMDKVCGPRMANDTHYYLMAMWSAVVYESWLPPTSISRELYNRVKLNKQSYPPHLVGFIGFGCSFGGRWFEGYAENSRGDNYCNQSRNSVVVQASKLADTILTNKDFSDLELPPGSLVYCDPPYRGRKGYSGSKKFDHGLFWDWCRGLHCQNHSVFVSEYEAPSDFRCVWEKPTTVRANKDTNHKCSTERLFTPGKII